MYLITSAAYVSENIRNEIGNIPPSFLPIRNERLYVHQLASLKLDEVVYLTIPDDYQLPEFDSYALEDAGVNIIRIPKNLSLGQSITYAINMIGIYDEPLRILHGDTLILDLPEMDDAFIVADSDDNYDWAVIDVEEHAELIYAGYFSFGDLKHFLKCVVMENYHFVDALERYKADQNTPLYKVSKWYDFGHINTFYRSKASMPTARHFNSMKINSRVVIKSSVNNRKILAESNWFEQLPSKLRYYTPQLVSVNKDEANAEYQLEYLYFIGLNELFVFGNQPLFIWNKIFSSCFEFISQCLNFKPQHVDQYINNDIYLKKTLVRIDAFLKDHPQYAGALSYNNKKLGTLHEIAIGAAKCISLPDEASISIVHGDFCFSNILYDFRRQDIKVIDPRGINVNGELDLFGDIRYDVSKLAHSIIGLYDYIIAGHYHLTLEQLDFKLEFPDMQSINRVQDVFYKNMEAHSGGRVDQKFLLAVMVQLFISMIPLHADSPSRQRAFIANALRLYTELEEL